jgi:signal transduction histidine kinase
MISPSGNLLMPEPSLFATVLASTVHDMKNSLSLLANQLDTIAARLEADNENRECVSGIRYESSRINLSLMQLLSLYKIDSKQFKVQVAEVEVADFIEDCVAAHSPVANSMGIELTIDCDDSLIWFFDPDLVGIAVNNVIGNSIRYTSSRLSVMVKVIDKQLVITIDDDGEGYPETMLQDPEHFMHNINYSTGSTGLGLFFSATVAHYHQRNKKTGKIDLNNDGALGGGSFSIYLP